MIQSNRLNTYKSILSLEVIKNFPRSTTPVVERSCEQQKNNKIIYSNMHDEAGALS